MVKIKKIQMWLMLVIFLSVVVMVSGCQENSTNKSGENNSTRDTNAIAVNEPSDGVGPLPQIGQDQSFYNFYNKVAVNQTKAEVDSALGVAPTVDEDGSYLYYDASTGYSVNVFYSASNLVTTKLLIAPEGGGDWIKLSTATVSENQVQKIEEGMTYQAVKDILGGDGLEMVSMLYPGTTNTVIYGLIWINPDFSSITVSFDRDTGKVLLAAEYSNTPV